RVTLVHADPSARIGLDPGLLEPEAFGARAPPRGEQDLLGTKGPPVLELRLEAPVTTCYGRDRSLGDDADPHPVERLGENLSHLRIERRQEVGPRVHDGHAHAER